MWFEEVAQRAGIDFTYRNGEESGHVSILESLGGGVGLLDFDADGACDIFLPGGGEYSVPPAGMPPAISGLPPAVYRNRGGWRFDVVTEPARASLCPYYSHGACVGDYDADGLPDVLVTGYGGLLLFHNLGDGTFREVAHDSGLDDRLWSSSAAWGDLNQDGHLDLYVAHYANWSFDNHPRCPGSTPDDRDVCPPRMFDGLDDTLYLSGGDGSFRDASRESGLNAGGKGLGVLIADVDLDGRVDVYVANDTDANRLYRNRGEGKLEDVSLRSGTALSDSGMPDGSMGVDLGDYNLDGLPDLWVANFERESFALYRNEGGCFFQHVSQSAGVTAIGGLYVGWGTLFLDFDHDGDEDIFCSNGHVIRFPSNAPLRQRPLLLENRAGRFLNVAGSAGPYFAAPHMGRGVAAGDLDGDGDLDLVISRTNERVSVLASESAGERAWISVDLIGSHSPRDAVGAVVEIETAAGRRVRQRKGGASYASSSDRRLHFGLGDATEVHKLTVRWPSGRQQTLADLPAVRMLTVQEHALGGVATGHTSANPAAPGSGGTR